MRFHSSFIATSSVLLFGIVPAAVLAGYQNVSPLEGFFILLHQLSTFLFFVSFASFFGMMFVWIVIASTLALYGVIISFQIAYAFYTGNPFDLLFLLDAYQVAVPTLVQVIGKEMTYLSWAILTCVGILSFILSFFAIGFMRHFRLVFRRWHRVVLILSATLFILPISQHGYVQSQHNRVQTVQEARKYVQPLFPEEEWSADGAKENVIILQLESFNALALNGLLQNKDGVYDGFYMPSLRRIAEDGIFFPYLWSNDMQTNRSQSAILCGIVRNIDRSYSFRIEDIPNVCLPEILQSAGYRTALFRSDRLGYAETGKFMQAMGMEELHYKDIMHEGDVRYGWGFDDCTFYQRSFEYLKNNPDDRPLFAYVEVSTNHVPFVNREEYAFVHEFPEPKNYLENYINASKQQDYCAGKFYDQFLAYDPENTHLFIISDTSWPVGTHGSTNNEWGAYNDNFLTPAVYIPPRRRLDEFRSGVEEERFFSLSDLTPTILDLLTGVEYQNSFASVLRSGGMLSENYEQCHILTQPYGDVEIAVVRNQIKDVYSIMNESLLRYNLMDDFEEQNPERISETMPPEMFEQLATCDRYQR